MTTTSELNLPCPDDTWRAWQGNCYKWSGYNNIDTWQGAYYQCRQAEADANWFTQANLVSIHSEEEEKFLNELSGEGTYYIGGIISDRQGSLLWNDRSEVIILLIFSLFPIISDLMILIVIGELQTLHQQWPCKVR